MRGTSLLFNMGSFNHTRGDGSYDYDHVNTQGGGCACGKDRSFEPDDVSLTSQPLRGKELKAEFYLVTRA